MAWGAPSQPWPGQLPGPSSLASDLMGVEEGGQSLGVGVEEEEGQSLEVVEEDPCLVVEVVGVVEEAVGPLDKIPILSEEKDWEVGMEMKVVGGPELHSLVRVEVAAHLH